MDPTRLASLACVAHDTFGRIRERTRSVFVPLHRAYTGVQAQRARAGQREIVAPQLLVEVPRLGLGDFLGARLVTWIVAGIDGTPVSGTATDPSVALALLLLDGPPARLDEFAEMTPLEWHDRARAATDTACREMHARIAAVVARSPTATAAPAEARIIEQFSTSVAGSLTSFDTYAIHARCVELLSRAATRA